MKRITLLSVILCLLSILPVAAENAYPYLFMDIESEMTGDEQTAVNQALANIGADCGIDAAVIIVESADGENVYDYAERFYTEGAENGAYQEDGVVLIYSPGESAWSMYTLGRAAELVSETDEDALWAVFAEGDDYYFSLKHYIIALRAHLQLLPERMDWPDELSETVAEHSPLIPEEALLPRLVDDADLLSESQEAALLAHLDEISERQRCDVIVVTVPSLDGKSSTAFADDFYDYNGYGYGAGDDGILFLLSMEDRDWAYSTYGFGIAAFTDAGQSYIFSKIKSDLGNDDWNRAFEKYASLCDEFLTAARDGSPIDIHNLPKPPTPWVMITIIALAASGLTALITVSILRRRSKGGVAEKTTAQDYMSASSLNLTKSENIFVGTQVSKTSNASQSSSGGRGGSSTHSSSSGRSHGGSSGKF